MKVDVVRDRERVSKFVVRSGAVREIVIVCF